MTAPVLFSTREVEGGYLGVATLNAPASLNSLSLEMIELLLVKLQQWNQSSDIVAVWLEAAGDKAFCAGGDIVRLYESMVSTAQGQRNQYAENFFGWEYRLDYLLHTFEKPVICWAQGIVMGGGLGLLSGCSHRVITENARIAMPEITIGLFPDVGGSWFLNRMPGKLGLFLGMTGANINATDALFTNLADRVLDQSSKESVFDQVCSLSWKGDYREDSASVGAVLQQAQLSSEQLPESQLRKHYDLIDRICDAQTLEQLVDQITGLETDDKWLARAVKTLTAGCAQTAGLVWEIQQRVAHLSLRQVFQMEWTVAVQCALHADFREGVRALLIDKDGSPSFVYDSVKQIPQDYLQGFFECPVPEHPLEDL